MNRLRKNKIGIVIIILLSFWPIWVWYGRRVLDPSDVSWEVVGLIGVITFVGYRCWKEGVKTVDRPFVLPSVFLAGYVLGMCFLPKLICAALAMCAFGSLLSGLFLGRIFHLGVVGGLIISLPVMASLQYYFGYPLRYITTWTSAGLLKVNGFAITQQGNALSWNNQLMMVDAPCSGIQMLWSSGILLFITSIYLDLKNNNIVLAGFFTISFLLFANGMRTASLFYIESGIVDVPGWFHDGIGLVVFFMICSFVLVSLLTGKRILRCKPVSFFS